jgi:hypothetical protein
MLAFNDSTPEVEISEFVERRPTPSRDPFGLRWSRKGGV